MDIFYEKKGIPVHSVQLLSIRAEAMGYPQGDMALGFCHQCGFIANVLYDKSLQEYSSGYESTQAFSATFNDFHRNLANYLIDRYDLHDKDIVEIGCGQGEFLTLLCEFGQNRGVGFDPAYLSERRKNQVSSSIVFIKDYYSEKYTEYQGDFICCKMTLEHISLTEAFVRTVRRTVGDRPDTIVFFQVPDVRRILQEMAFWDIYYEHCSYFSLGSLSRLFRRCGFHVVDLWKGYENQYLMLEAKPASDERSKKLLKEDDLDDLVREVSSFRQNLPAELDGWRKKIEEIKKTGKRCVMWGAGSKGVAFLTTLEIQDEIEYAVDINPHKHGTYMAGTGQKIVPPDFLRKVPPDVVIIMNPVYGKEIQDDLEKIGLRPELLPVGKPIWWKR
jgi:SAM-dependent methyltransferase